MSIGKSGRIVIEINPDLKRELYGVLAKSGLTLKDWFVEQAGTYVSAGGQLNLHFSDPEIGESSYVLGSKNSVVV